MKSAGDPAVEPNRTAIGRPGRFGRLGLDVGAVGRWSRLAWGALILLPLLFGAAADLRGTGASLTLYGLGAAYFLGAAATYLAVYKLLGERLFARANPWVNTFILVGPAFLIAWWSAIITPTTGIELPDGLSLGMLGYIGVSFILQWRIGYGGCEVVALPIILFGRRYTTYCLPLVALDVVEKAVMDRGHDDATG